MSQQNPNPQQPYAQQPYAQQPYAPQPGAQQHLYGATPQPPAKKPFFKRVSTWVGIVIVIVVLGAIGGSREPSGGSADKAGAAATPATQAASATKAAQPPATTAPPAAPGLNTPVRSGQFEAKVTGVKTGVKSVGSSGIDKKAKGQFVLVSVEVKNTGDRAQYVSDNDIKLVSGGQEFSADSTAGIYMGDEAFLFEQLNPGSELKGKIAFDVPAGFKVETLKFSGGLFDTDATINLKG